MHSLASGSVNQRNSVVNTTEIQQLSQLLAQQQTEWALEGGGGPSTRMLPQAGSGSSLALTLWQCHRDSTAARNTSPPAGKCSLMNHCLVTWGYGILACAKFTFSTLGTAKSIKILPSLWPRWCCTAMKSRRSLCIMVLKNKRGSHKMSMPEGKNYP